MNLIQMSLTGSLLILLIVVLRAAASRRLPKMTFLLLWEIVVLRLLLPFSIPLPFSVYAKTEHLAGLVETKAATLAFLADASSSAAVFRPAAPSIPTLIWLAGAGLGVFYFAVSYWREIRRFQMSLPSDSPFLKAWLDEHPIIRPVAIRVSDQILSPVTYGILHPVILLPSGIDHQDSALLTYILTHEYVHIRRFDGAAKFFFAAALCVHWFNPLVWIMYILANRDMELSCDAHVVQILGEETKAAYALALLHMEEVKGRGSPLFSHFSRYAMEERVQAIMKYQNPSAFTVALSIVLLIGAAGFAVSSPAAAGASPQFADLAFDPAPGSCDSMDGLNDWLLALQAEAARLVGENQLTQAQADEILLFYQKRAADLNAAAAAGAIITVDKTDGGTEPVSYPMDQLSYVLPAIYSVFENDMQEGTLSDIAIRLPSENGALFCMALQNGRE